MKSKIHPSVVLGKVAKLEQAAHGLYSFYVDLFEDHPPVRKLFVAMRNEELSHKNQVLFQKRIVDKNPNGFPDMEVDLSIVDTLLQKVEAHVSDGVFHVTDALDFAIEFEESACEALVRTELSRYSGELAKLSKHLVAHDDAHVGRLKEMRAEYEGRSSFISDL